MYDPIDKQSGSLDCKKVIETVDLGRSNKEIAEDRNTRNKLK